MAFSDKDNIWWLESIGGHHWIACRVPDDKVVIMPNQNGIDYFDFKLTEKTAGTAKGYNAVCVFVNDVLDKTCIHKLGLYGVQYIILRCAGFNNVDLEAAGKHGITVLRVPGYSPEAVAEHAMMLALAVNRHVHKSYIKVRENNFSLQGLTGINFYGKTAGIVGTGKIGAAMCRICHGFGMKVIAYDPLLGHARLQELSQYGKFVTELDERVIDDIPSHS